jgi:arylsulfatase A-like enzyme
VAGGVLSERQARQLRACYGGKLTMIDRWFGGILAALDRGGLWDSTAVIVCTDHGHYLGERDAFGKPALPVFEPMGHIPLLVAWPGVAAGTRSALTTNVDVHATLLELFGVRAAHRTHGRSLAPLVRGEVDSVRDWALSGYWGREVHVLDGRSKYARAPSGPNAPLSIFSNRWSMMPVHRMPELRLPLPDDRARLDRMPGSKVPVIRQPFGAGDRLPFWALGGFLGNHLYDLTDDPAETANRAGTAAEKRAEELLRTALLELEVPDDQLARLGLA